MKSSRVSERFDIAGKVAIVTGAASGIGRAIALDLAEAGAKVAVADKALGGAEEVAREIQSVGGKAIAIKTDVTDSKDVEQMAQRTIEKFGKIDILINNAGIIARSSVLDMKEDDLDRTFDVNLKGVVLCSQAAARHMIERKSGKIVNIGSSLSSRASVCNLSGGGADYCASKAAVQALTRSLAMELGPYGINVNSVAPGPTNTPMHEGLWEMAAIYYQNSVPLGRLAEPEDIADVVVFLVTDAARYITGQTIHVNGGQIMVD
ncbi:MAG: 3-oxoacyl-ACP reductase FabG [Dehalococcoidia bacterium]|nr:MAG: 3-oxoacyl-ACP reductase FabG [Dehalococcoidia bacterium]